MFDSTFELITLAASSSLVIFCFCNLIIATVLIGVSKPIPHLAQDTSTATTPSPGVSNGDHNDLRDANAQCSVDNHNATATTPSPGINNGDQNYMRDANAKCSVDNHNASTGVCRDDKGEVNDSEEDDELRRRAEEFIHKINQGWKAEKLRTSAWF